jgi:hypothetical protein
MEPEGSLPRSQEPSTGPYPENNCAVDGTWATSISMRLALTMRDIFHFP